MLSKKTKGKGFTTTTATSDGCPDVCRCDQSNDTKQHKQIKGDVRKLSDRSRTLRNEHYPEKRKKSRPCSFMASSTSEINKMSAFSGRSGMPEYGLMQGHTYHVKSSGLETPNQRDNSDNSIDQPVKTANFESPKFSRTNPFETPAKGTSPHKIKHNKHSEEITLVQQYVVTYCCTIDLDVNENEDVYNAGLKTLANCVERSIVDPIDTSTSAVLLSISTMGVKLTNSFGNNVMTCPLDKVLYNFLSQEDGRYFGFVTDPTSDSVSSSVSSYSNNYESYSCHVLMVDSNFANHAAHQETASALGISCKQILSGCQQFPYSPAVILDEVNSFYKTRNFINHYSPSSFGSGTLGRSRVNSVDQQPTSLDNRYGSSFTGNPTTPDKQIISSTLERIRGHAAYSSTPRDAKKLMISPPSSLAGLNEEEKKQLLNELEERKRSQSEDEDSLPRSSQHHNSNHTNNNDTFRRKSTSEVELFGTIGSCQTKLLFSGTNSIGTEHRKPPLAPQKYSKNTSEPTSATFFQGLKRTSRRRSDNPPSFSPKAGIKELFFKASSKNRKTTTSTQFYQHEEEEDLMRQLNSISSSTSDQSLELKSVGSVEAWSQSLEKLLADPSGLRSFHEFLKKEFSEENLLFWVACERFRKLKDSSQVAIAARKIYANYLSRDAAFLVNIDAGTLKKTECELDTPHLTMFNIPQQQVFQLMKFDSYNRFLKSETYHNYLHAEKSGRRLHDMENNNSAFRKNQMMTKSMRSPTSSGGGERKKNPLSFLHRGKIPASPDHETIRKQRSSSLGAYEECNRNNIVGTVGEANGNISGNNLLLNGSSRSKIVRVVLPDGTSGFIVGEMGKSLRDGLKELVESKNLQLQKVDVSVGHEKKTACLDSDISCLDESVVYLEKRILFRFDLPNGRSVGLKSNPNKSLRDVLLPVMKANSYDLDEYSILLMNTKIPLSLDMCISTLENKRLVAKPHHKTLDKQNSDPASSRIRTQGFHASFRKYRTNNKLSGQHSNHDKLTCTRADEAASALMVVLQKCQSSRIDDQRGMLPRNIELPDFLKVTSSTPAPVRSKPIETSNMNLSVSSNPLPCAPQFPGSPFFIDKSFKDLTDKLNLSLSSSLDNHVRASLNNSHGDSSFDSTCSVNVVYNRTGMVSTFPRPTVTKVKLIGLSKSDSLLTGDNLITVSNSLTREGGNLGGNARDMSTSEMTDDVFVSNTGSLSYGDNYDNENNSNDDKYIKTRTLSNGRGRPLPISNFNESEVLHGLDEDEDEVVDVQDGEGRNTRGRKNNAVIRDSGIGTHPSNSGTNLNFITTDTCETATTNSIRRQKPPDLKLALLAVPNSHSAERIGTVDIVDYNVSPRALERFRKFSLDDQQMRGSKEIVMFEGNAVPTPQKGKLLSGETVKGRQNEKITFV